MVSTRRATYEAPPPTPTRRRSLHQEVANADAIPRGDLDSDSYWSGSEDSASNNSLAVASSNGSASVLSDDSTMGTSNGSPKALSNDSAGGRVEPDLSQSVVSSVLHSAAILRTSLSSTTIGSSCASLPSTAIGISSRDETGHLLSCAQAPSASASVAGSIVIPAPDMSSVAAGDGGVTITAGTELISWASIASSSDTTYHVPIPPRILELAHLPSSSLSGSGRAPRRGKTAPKT
ncbi:hypothetical protein B0H14DRAFT_2979990 [Mycena olivaceomarginata]|nr:hypothetical protein B0H14DRAFT_2979990 [Mycena olivaceomarginata]